MYTVTPGFGINNPDAGSVLAPASGGFDLKNKCTPFMKAYPDPLTASLST